MVTIRKADSSEAEAILGFYHSVIEKMKTRPVRPTWTKGVYPVLDNLLPALRSESLLVAVDDESIVGSVILTDKADPAYDLVPWTYSASRVSVVHLLAVEPDRHGQGIARRLLEGVTQLAAERGFEVIRLDTLPYNTEARSLYSHFGFRYCGDIELYYPSAGKIPFSMYEYML